jgi:phosphatidylserine decarboxylase
VNPPRSEVLREWRYTDQDVQLKKGDEMGRFLLGSTVVLLFPPQRPLRFNPAWAPARSVRLGEAMADAPSAA